MQTPRSSFASTIVSAAVVDGRPAWVHLVGNGESTVDIEAGQQLTMSGVERPVVADLATMGLPSDQLSKLETRTAYLEVAFDAVTVTG